MISLSATRLKNDDSAAGATATPSVEQFNESQQIGTLTMNYPTTTTASSTPSDQRHTIDHIIDTPLPQLLTEHNARIVEITSIDDLRFFGQLVHKRDGQVILAMPAGRDDTERDCAARILLAHMNGLPLDGFPDVFAVTDVVKNGVDVL